MLSATTYLKTELVHVEIFGDGILMVSKAVGEDCKTIYFVPRYTISLECLGSGAHIRYCFLSK